jgi:hypothetical protein
MLQRRASTSSFSSGAASLLLGRPATTGSTCTRCVGSRARRVIECRVRSESSRHETAGSNICGATRSAPVSWCGPARKSSALIANRSVEGRDERRRRAGGTRRRCDRPQQRPVRAGLAGDLRRRDRPFGELPESGALHRTTRPCRRRGKLGRRDSGRRCGRRRRRSSACAHPRTSSGATRSVSRVSCSALRRLTCRWR